MFDSLTTKTSEGRFRIASVVGAALPAICIFGFGRIWPTTDNQSAANVKGRPPGSVFGIAWTIVTIAWFVSWATMAIYANIEYLIAIWIINVIIIIMNITWLWMYNSKKNKVGATQLLFAIFGFVLLTLVVIICSPYDLSESYNPRTVAASTIVPLLGWILFASCLSLQEINQS